MSDRSYLARLLAVAVAALLVFGAVYVGAVRTEVGQRADDAALDASVQTPERARSGSNNLLSVVSNTSLAVAVAALGGVAWLRRRPRLILLPAAVVGSSLIATELLKHVILTRPDLVADLRIPENSYPSGHTTVAASLGVSLLLVAPPAVRSLAALAATAFAGGFGALTVLAAWHRPSDPIGSFAITLACTALALLVFFVRYPDLLRRERAEAERAPPGRFLAWRIELVGLLGGAIVVAGAFALAVFVYGTDIEWTRPDAAFLLSVGAIVAAAGLMVGAVLRILPPPAEPDDRPEPEPG